MKLLKLELHNFGYWEDVTVNFTDQKQTPTACSKIILCGEQESGKSTIGRALRWCLYGDLVREPKKSYPFAWDGLQNDEQFVRAIFLHPVDGQLIVTRSRSPPTPETTKSLKVNSKDIPKQAVQMTWERYFGKEPIREEEVEFLLRVQQMVETAKTIANPQVYQSRLLSFVNMENILDRMNEVVQALNKEMVAAAAASKAPDAVKELQRLTGLIEDLQEKIEVNEDEITTLEAFLKEWQEDESEVLAKIATSEKHATAQSDKINAIGQTAIARAKFQSEFEKVFPSSLYGMLVDAGKTDALPSKDTATAKDLRLQTVLDEFGSYLSEDSKAELEKLIDPDSELNCVLLLDAPALASEIIILCDALKVSLTNLSQAEAKMLEVMSEISVKPGDASSAKLQKAEALASAQRKTILQEENKTIIDQIDMYKDQQQTQRDLISDASGEGDVATRLSEEIKIAEAICKATRQARNEYVNTMFDRLVNEIQNFWKEIDDGHSQASIEYDKETQQIKLKGNQHGEWIDLQYGDGEGDASSGQFEKALLCMAMARIKILGLEMPVFLDDAMGDIDPNHKKRAIESASKHFGQVIYTTNSPQTIEDLTKLDLKISTVNPKQPTKGIEYEVL